MTDRPMAEEERAELIKRLRDRDAVVMAGLFHAIPAMREAADEIERLSAAVRGMREAAQNVIEQAQTSVTDHEGQQHAMEDDRGEALYLVQFEAIEQLRAVLSGIETEQKQARSPSALSAPTDRLQSKESSS